MDEPQAHAWFASRDVPRETIHQLETLAAMVLAENERQNLIARSTITWLWARHMVDSAQLLDLADMQSGRWCDIGTGAGFPGAVVALLRPGPIDWIEPRARRCAFLQSIVAAFDLAARVHVIQRRAEAVNPDHPYDVISARAVASLTDLLHAARGLSAERTTWLLPKGRSAEAELAEARRTWQGDFRLVPSITDPSASIVVARNVRPR